MPLPFGLLFRPHTGAAGEFLSTEAPTSSALDGGGLDGTMNNTPLNMYGYNTTIHHGRQNIEVKNMYKVMGFKEAVATRKVFLLNEETGTQETCFDDSGLAGEENFLFMKQGEHYECKIKLFGRLGLPEDSDLLACTVLERRVPVGVRKLAKVQVGQDIYYILEKELKDVGDVDVIYYSSSRRDLIQVDNVLHADYLDPFYAD